MLKLLRPRRHPNLDPAWAGHWPARGISPNVVTPIGTLGLVACALFFYPRGQLFWGTMVITVFVLSDLLDGIMARMTGTRQPLGGLPRLHPRPGGRRGDLRRAGALVRRERPAGAGAESRCSASSPGHWCRTSRPGREGAGHDVRRRHRRAAASAWSWAWSPPVSAGSACRTSCAAGLWLLAAASAGHGRSSAFSVSAGRPSPPTPAALR